MKMTTVRQVIKAKGSEVWTITPDALVYEALKVMADKRVGALLVLEEAKLVGIFSERDYARGVALKQKSSKTTHIREIMTQVLFTVTPEETIDRCMQIMTEDRVRHLPVLEGQQLVGIISIGDVVKQIIADQEFAIKQLENYISGTGYGRLIRKTDS